MLAEGAVAVLVGFAVLWLVLEPLISPARSQPLPPEPIDPEETPKGIALTALKEIEFDRETGKLSESDYQLLKTKYTATALEALRRETEEVGSGDIEALIAAKVRALRFASAAISSNEPTSRLSGGPACNACGPRPEPDALFCSSCGRRLPDRLVCDQCGAALTPDSRFCDACGRRVAA
ncbi:MAG: zinc ribbon domain-containing protein [Gemmatimonadales bacterium]